MNREKILNAAIFTPLSTGAWGLPMCLWGPPGVAKTATIKSLSNALGWRLEHLCPGERGEGAFGVTPVPNTRTDGRMVVEYPPPDWVDFLVDENGEEAGMVFVDELNTAPPALQPALLGILQERRIGGYQFGPRVRIVGAANPVDQAAGGWDIAPPVANRMGHLTWPCPGVDAWASWAMGATNTQDTMDAQFTEAVVMGKWPDEFSKVTGMVTAFLRRRPDLLHRMPNFGDPGQGKAWPSPRTWDMAMRAKASAAIQELSTVDDEEFVTSFIGAGAANEFFVWVGQADLPDPRAVLDGSVPFVVDQRRLDRTDAILSACTTLLVSMGKESPEKAAFVEKMWEILFKTTEKAKDLVVMPITSLMQNSMFGAATGARNSTLAAVKEMMSAANGGK